MKTILLVGESWTSSATHYKGWDQFSSTTFHLGAKDLIKSVESEEIKIDYMTAHEAAESFPSKLEKLKIYDGIILVMLAAIPFCFIPKYGLMVKLFLIDYS